MKSVVIKATRDRLTAKITVDTFPPVHTHSVWVSRGACQDARIEIGELIISKEKAKQLRDQLDSALTIAEHFDGVPCREEHLWAFWPKSEGSYRVRATDHKIVAEKADALPSGVDARQTSQVAQLVDKLRDLATSASA